MKGDFTTFLHNKKITPVHIKTKFGIQACIQTFLVTILKQTKCDCKIELNFQNKNKNLRLPIISMESIRS